MTRPPKKSDTLEVRMPYATKSAFMARCRDDGGTASDAVRRFIEAELTSERPRRAASRWWTLAAAAAAGLALGAVAAPSLAHPVSGSKAAFERLDANRDGALSLEEFRAG